jgi:hypothetical protein
MLVAAPSVGSRTVGFAVETAARPGVYFDLDATGLLGQVTIAEGAGAGIKYHRFGLVGSIVGDMNHTDNTRHIFWDASANTLSLQNASGTDDITISGSVATVFNEQGLDRDFRIEGDTDANLFFGDASTDRVGIGNNAPSEKLDVTGTVKLSGELKGARVVFTGGARTIASGTTSGYVTTDNLIMTSTMGMVMPRAGSIVGITGLVLASGHAGAGNMTFEARVNNTVVFSAAVNVTGNGVFTVVSTQARGTDTFAAGDLVQLSWTNAGTYAKDTVFIVLETQFDT